MTTDLAPKNLPAFRVVLLGIRDDIPIDTIHAAFADLLKVTPEQINQIFKTFPCILKKKIRADQASQYQAAIETAGGICRIEGETLKEVTLITAHSIEPADVQPLPVAVPKGSPASNHQRAVNALPSDAIGKARLAAIFQKIVSKARNFLLLDIPERSIPLNFKLPSASVRAKVGSGSSAELHEFEDNSLEYFKLLHVRIKFLNFAKLRMGARLRANRHLLKLFYMPAHEHLLELAKTGGVPELEGRRKTLILISDISSIIITSCTFVFASYYEGSKYRYASNRVRVLELAAYIFELLLLKQRARALRYQLLDSSDWQIANTVFHVMRAYENTERPMLTLKLGLDVDIVRAKKSLSDHFILLQTYAWFDQLRLPTHLQWVIGSYLLKVKDAVQITDDTKSLGDDELLVYCYGKRPTETVRLNGTTDPALILNLHNLIEAMREDCLVNSNASARGALLLMPRFANFETADHFVIRNQFASRLVYEQEKVVLTGNQEADDLRIFVGFAAVFAMLRHRKSEFASDERLEDRLSERSATFSVDEKELRKSRWSFSFQSESMTRFTTTEGKDTTAMDIGMLLAYGAGAEFNRPKLAVVSRISRPHGKILELDMRFVARACHQLKGHQNLESTENFLISMA